MKKNHQKHVKHATIQYQLNAYLRNADEVRKRYDVTSRRTWS